METELKDMPGLQKCFWMTFWWPAWHKPEEGIAGSSGKWYQTLGCVFAEEVVNYLGHHIDWESLCERKLVDIMRRPEPKNIQELRSFLGHIPYYQSFVPICPTYFPNYTTF